MRGAVEPAYYTVISVNGDYAYLRSDGGIESQVALFLLPPVDVGSRLVYENFEWSLT